MSVVPIDPGRPVFEIAEPQPYVIEVLEELLEAGRSGEIQGIAVARVWPDRTASYRLAGLHSFSLLGAAKAAVDDLSEQVRGS